MSLAEFPWPVPDPTYGGVRLRPYEPACEAADLVMVRGLATDPYLPLTGSLPPYADEDQARAYVQRQRGRLGAGLGFMFVIADRADAARSLGFAALWGTGLEQGRTTIGYAVAPAARGRGVASQAVSALLGFAWTIAAVHRVEAYVEPWNTGSWRACERAGMVREGLLRSHQEIGGTRRDMLIYAAIRP